MCYETIQLFHQVSKAKKEEESPVENLAEEAEKEPLGEETEKEPLGEEMEKEPLEQAPAVAGDRTEAVQNGDLSIPDEHTKPEKVLSRFT